MKKIAGLSTIVITLMLPLTAIMAMISTVQPLIGQSEWFGYADIFSPGIYILYIHDTPLTFQKQVSIIWSQHIWKTCPWANFLTDYIGLASVILQTAIPTFNSLSIIRTTLNYSEQWTNKNIRQKSLIFFAGTILSLSFLAKTDVHQHRYAC